MAKKSKGFDRERYAENPGYRRMIDGARRGGRKHHPNKRETAVANLAKSAGRPKWGLSPEESARVKAWIADGSLANQEQIDQQVTYYQETRRVEEWLKARGWSLSLERGCGEEEDEAAAAYLVNKAEGAPAGVFLEWAAGDKRDPYPDESILAVLVRYRLEAGERHNVGGFDL